MSTTAPKTSPSEATRWRVALYFALGYTALVTAYLYYLVQASFDLAFVSSLSSATAGFMLATSFSASSASYFFGWPNMRDGYQKQIGIVAFWLCVAYCVTLLFLQPDVYYYGFFEHLATPNFILGLSAMVIFGLMVVLNSKLIAPHLEWNTIRLFLNLGYFGYGLLVMRAIFLEWPQWVEWFTTFSTLPTNRFLLSVLAVAVLLFRLAVILHRRTKTKIRT